MPPATTSSPSAHSTPRVAAACSTDAAANSSTVAIVSSRRFSPAVSGYAICASTVAAASTTDPVRRAEDRVPARAAAPPARARARTVITIGESR